MKTMKIFHFVILTGLLILVSSPDIFAVIQRPDPVGVPLDGGLLAILAGAGIVYYAAKKRKKSD